MNIVKHLIKTKVLLILLMLFCQQPASGNPAADLPGHILHSMQTMEAAYPGQKVFLHLDKEEYLAGETIWLKSYVVNATTHKPDSLSTNLHIQLVTATGDIASSLLLRLENGVAHGDILLPDSITGGNYEFIAYTDWMKNFDERLIFNKDIYVINPIEENFIKFSDIIRNRRFNRRLSRKADRMQFAFFPEGGNLLAGVVNKVAFKAANELGAGVQASGILSDEQGHQLLAFETLHNGMGRFSITPEAGRTYTAKITFENGDVKKIALPKAEPEGFLLSVSEDNDAVEIRVTTNPGNGARQALADFYLMVQTRGRPYHIEKGTFDSEQHITRIPLSTLPTGICQVMLFSTNGTPVAERLIFVNKGELNQAVVTSFNKQTIDESEMYSVGLKFDNEVAGSYSLAILETDKTKKDYRATILSELLLFSDLGYTLKNPGWYLDQSNPNAKEALDLIMMTHGWKRFDIQKIINEEFPIIRYGFPEGIAIRGSVTPKSSDKKTGEVKVELSIHQEQIDMYETTTDDEGNFLFSGLDYDGLFTAKLSIDMPYDRRAMNIRLADSGFAETEYTKSFQTRPLLVTSRGDDWERVSRPETVLMRRRHTRAGEERKPSMYAQASQVIYFDEIRYQYSNMQDIIRAYVRGVQIVDGRIMLRGSGSIFLSNEPLFFIDEIVVGRAEFLRMNVRHVDRMAVLSGPQSAILGSRGTNGALLLYTIRGDTHEHTTYDYVIQGFHEPSETFEAKIHTEKHERFGTDRTLFWDPDFSTGGDTAKSISFPGGKNHRSLRLILQGVDENGRITFFDEMLD